MSSLTVQRRGRIAWCPYRWMKRILNSQATLSMMVQVGWLENQGDKKVLMYTSYTYTNFVRSISGFNGMFENSVFGEEVMVWAGESDKWSFLSNNFKILSSVSVNFSHINTHWPPNVMEHKYNTLSYQFLQVLWIRLLQDWLRNKWLLNFLRRTWEALRTHSLLTRMTRYGQQLFIWNEYNWELKISNASLKIKSYILESMN